MTEQSTGAALWTVQAEFTDRDDAVAFMDLARELGVLSHLSSRSINKNRSPIRETRIGRLILRSMEPGRSYELEWFRALCEENDYQANSASPALSKLVEQGDVVKATRGTFELPKATTLLCGVCKTMEECSKKGWCAGGQHPLPRV